MRLKVKKFIPKTVFKAVLMATAIPFIIFAILFILERTLGLTLSGNNAIFLSLLYLLISPIVYGVIFILLAISYNWLAPKFGGLEVDVDDTFKKEIDL